MHLVATGVEQDIFFVWWEVPASPRSPFVARLVIDCFVVLGLGRYMHFAGVSSDLTRGAVDLMDCLWSGTLSQRPTP